MTAVYFTRFLGTLCKKARNMQIYVNLLCKYQHIIVIMNMVDSVVHVLQ